MSARWHAPGGDVRKPTCAHFRQQDGSVVTELYLGPVPSPLLEFRDLDGFDELIHALAVARHGHSTQMAGSPRFIPALPAPEDASGPADGQPPPAAARQVPPVPADSIPAGPEASSDELPQREPDGPGPCPPCTFGNHEDCKVRDSHGQRCACLDADHQPGAEDGA